MAFANPTALGMARGLSTLLIRRLSVAALLTSIACGRVDRFLTTEFPDPQVNRGLIGFVPSSATGLADSASVITLTATLDRSGLAPGTTVTFTTTLGSLLPFTAMGGSSSTVTAMSDTSGAVVAQLRAPHDTGTALLTATSGNITRTLTIFFGVASATSLQVLPMQPGLKSGASNSVPITVTLLRKSGSPTPRGMVHFYASLGQFSADSLVAAGSSVTVSYTAGDTTYVGPVTIRATATRDTATTATGNATLLITKP
jgi:hypothetical protein